MGISRVRVFAGPNGSGKTELIKRLRESGLPLGPIVNADLILEKLQNTSFIDLKEFRLSNISDQDWERALKEIDELASRVQKAGNIPPVKIKQDVLVCNSEDLNAYVAALISDFIRYLLLEQQISFSFETVMSHPGKIDFLKIARQKGFKTYLYFIATDDPEINVSRVKNRVKKVGTLCRSKRLWNDMIEALIFWHKRLRLRIVPIYWTIPRGEVLCCLKRRMTGKGIYKSRIIHAGLRWQS